MLKSYNEMVLVKDIELLRLPCEHHMLPFLEKPMSLIFLMAHVVGLSKIPRIVDVFSRRLQVQERPTEFKSSIVSTTTLEPKGAVDEIEASHMCMMMRGVVQKQKPLTTTSGFRGTFEKMETRK